MLVLFAQFAPLLALLLFYVCRPPPRVEQVSHVSTECDYPLGAEAKDFIEDEWAISQVTVAAAAVVVVGVGVGVGVRVAVGVAVVVGGGVEVVVVGAVLVLSLIHI